jgi:prepilin peptidase CpaA
MAVKILLQLLVVVAAFLDLRSRQIPNRLTLTGVLAGLSSNVYLAGWRGLKTGLLGMLLALFVYGLLFAIRAMGGGDVKLMAAVGSFTGPEQWFSIFVITSIVGGLFAVITLVTRGGFVRAFSNIGAILGSFAHFRAPHQDRPDLDVSHSSARTLPHGAAIAVGVLVYLLWLAPR